MFPPPNNIQPTGKINKETRIVGNQKERKQKKISESNQEPKGDRKIKQNLLQHSTLFFYFILFYFTQSNQPTSAEYPSYT